jgi:hypothetical protein
MRPISGTLVFDSWQSPRPRRVAFVDLDQGAPAGGVSDGAVKID